MHNADIMPLVTSNKKVCEKENDLSSENDFKLDYLWLFSSRKAVKSTVWKNRLYNTYLKMGDLEQFYVVLS